MHRENLLQLLSEYSPSLEEVEAKSRIIEFIKNNENCFERSLKSGHITASAWLLNTDGDKALLTHHAKLNKWFQLGGHCDGDSNVLEVAIKEAIEESGIQDIEPVIKSIFDIDAHLIPSNSKEDEHYHYDIRFLLKTTSNDDFKLSDESKELKWISMDISSLPTQERSVTRMFEKWIGFNSTL